jgi:hypothetical protein
MEELLVPKSIPTNILPTCNNRIINPVQMSFTSLVLQGFANHFRQPMTIGKPRNGMQDFSLFILLPPIDNNLIGFID